MLTKTNKIILIVFFSILGIGVLFLVTQFLSLRNADRLGYNEVSKSNYVVADLIKEDKLADIEIDYSYSNSVNNKLLILDYDKNYKLVICKINEYRGINNSSIILNKYSKIGQDDRKTYGMISTQEEPYVVIQSKTNLPETEKLYFKIDKSTKIIREEHVNNIDAYEFNMTQIGFSSELSKNDFIISSFAPMNVSFAISTDGNNFVCYMLYSLKGKRAELETLLDLIKKANNIDL